MVFGQHEVFVKYVFCSSQRNKSIKKVQSYILHPFKSYAKNMFFFFSKKPNIPETPFGIFFVLQQACP